MTDYLIRKMVKERTVFDQVNNELIMFNCSSCPLHMKCNLMWLLYIKLHVALLIPRLYIVIISAGGNNYHFCVKYIFKVVLILLI